VAALICVNKDMSEYYIWDVKVQTFVKAVVLQCDYSITPRSGEKS